MSPFLANFSFCFCPLSICERVHSLAAKIFCVCENVRPSLIQTKNGSLHSRFLPFFAPSRGLFCIFARRGQAHLSARVHFMPNMMLHLLPIFLFFLGLGKKMFLFVLPIMAHFFAAVNTYAEKLSTGGLADPSSPARCTSFSVSPFLHLAARGKVLMPLSIFLPCPFCGRHFFCFTFPLPCQIAAKKACSLMQWLTAPFFSPRLFPHKTIYRSPFPVYPFHLHAFAPLSAIQCPPALRFPARFRKTIMLLFL